jgi:hypothetical protein
VDFTGKPKEIGGLAGLLPSAAVYEFELELAGEGKSLEVVRASWRPWSPPASPRASSAGGVALDSPA